MAKNKDITMKNEESWLEEQQEIMDKYGWIAHFVFETEQNEFGGMANIHTHGLPQSFDHPDLQIILPINPQVAHGIFHTMVDAIKNGTRYYSNKRHSDVLVGYDVYIQEETECDRPVLRVIIPDSKGRFPFDEGCEDVYNRQMDKLPEDDDAGMVH